MLNGKFLVGGAILFHMTGVEKLAMARSCQPRRTAIVHGAFHPSRGE